MYWYAYLSLQFIGTSCSSIAQSSSCLCVIGISHIISSWVYCWIMAHPSSCDKVDCYVYTKSIVSPISLWSYHWRIPTRKYFTYYMPYHRGSCCRSEGSWCVHINVFVWMGINFVTCMHIICQLAWAEWEDGQWSAPRRLYYIHIGRLWRWHPSSSDLYLSSSPNMMATSSLVLYCSASCDTDMAGHEHHHRWHYYAILVDDLLLPSWLDHKTTSKIVHQLRHKI